MATAATPQTGLGPRVLDDELPFGGSQRNSVGAHVSGRSGRPSQALVWKALCHACAACMRSASTAPLVLNHLGHLPYTDPGVPSQRQGTHSVGQRVFRPQTAGYSGPSFQAARLLLRTLPGGDDGSPPPPSSDPAQARRSLTGRPPCRAFRCRGGRLLALPESTSRTLSFLESAVRGSADTSWLSFNPRGTTSSTNGRCAGTTRSVWMPSLT